MSLRHSRVFLLVSCVLALASTARGQGAEKPEAKSYGTLRDGFETDRTVWRQEQTDATINLLGHERSRRAAHGGQFSERFHFNAGVGSSFLYSYPLPRIPVIEDLRVELFVRSNRVGARLLGRVVLPKDIDPNTGQPSFVMITGTSYENGDRWQRIELTDIRSSVERQVRVLRADTKRPVETEGAYLERVVVNLFSGTGETELFIDDLAITPVQESLLAAAQPLNTPSPASPSLPDPTPSGEPTTPDGEAEPRVRLEGVNKLVRRARDLQDYDWIPTAIDAPGTPVGQLSQHGFDLFVDKVTADPDRFKEALQWNMLLMPDLDLGSAEKPTEPTEMAAAASEFPFREDVAFWNVGNRLGHANRVEAREQELDRIRETNALIRKFPPPISRLTAGDVEGELAKFSFGPKRVSMLSITPNVWGSAQEPMDTYKFLKQRRQLNALENPGGLFLAWLPAVAPASVVTSVWGQDPPPAWGMPRVQPEQLRLFTYLALAAGYRGIGFRADADLTTMAGRAQLIEMAFLNEEIDLCESIISRGGDPVPLYDTFNSDPSPLPPPGSSPTMRVRTQKEGPPHPSIKAAGIATQDLKGTLLLVADFAGAAQFQPSQMAKLDVNLVVPAPESAQAYEISPGNVHPLERSRVPGGTRYILPDFGGTSLVLVTTDFAMAKRIEEAIKGARPRACQLAIEQATLQLREAEEITNRLIADGHTLYDPNDPSIPRLPIGARPPNEEEKLLKLADSMIKTAQENFERMDYPKAWSEARMAGRTLRHLKFAQWSKAYAEMSKLVTPEPPKPARTGMGRKSVAELEAEREAAKIRTPNILMPVSSPPLVSYNTLPQHYIWLDWMARSFSPNLLKGGGFDNHAALQTEGWSNQSYQFEGIESKISTVADEEYPAQRYLKLSVRPKDRDIDTLAPFLDFPAAAIQTPPIKVTAGQFLRLSVMVQKTNPSTGGQGGVIIRDSIGGETLQIRKSVSIPKFSKVIWFRRAPADGELTVTLGLAEFGDAYFDDLTIETVEGNNPGPQDQYADHAVRRTIPGVKPPQPEKPKAEARRNLRQGLIRQ